jgi:hypothetical protein
MLLTDSSDTVCRQTSICDLVTKTDTQFPKHLSSAISGCNSVHRDGKNRSFLCVGTNGDQKGYGTVYLHVTIANGCMQNRSVFLSTLTTVNYSLETISPIICHPIT